MLKGHVWLTEFAVSILVISQRDTARASPGPRIKVQPRTGFDDDAENSGVFGDTCFTKLDSEVSVQETWAMNS